MDCRPFSIQDMLPLFPQFDSLIRFIVEDTVEESVHTICQHRASRMDMGMGQPGGGSGAAAASATGGRSKGSLTIRDVTLLLRLDQDV